LARRVRPGEDNRKSGGKAAVAAKSMNCICDLPAQVGRNRLAINDLCAHADCEFIASARFP
jgi:hypothetical protein